MKEIASALRDHRLPELFIESLGWDRAPQPIDVEIEGRVWHFEMIAQKWGLKVFWCRTDRIALLNRAFLRSIQQKIIRLAHEHVLILSCEEPKKQVWLWAVRAIDGRRVRHREHPFFSADPPLALLNRLVGLRFDFAEEGTASLVDALDRVRMALDVQPELNLFAKMPSYAARSDALANRMKSGGVPEFHEFLLFHLNLARKLSKCLRRWFGMEPEDAEQIAILGLIRAAQKFEPERGYQFSTYASWWIKNACQLHGPYFALPIRVPINAFWPCFYDWIRFTKLQMEKSPGAARDFHAERECTDPKWAKRWRGFVASRNVRSLSEVEWKLKARRLPESSSNPLDCFTRPEVAVAVRKGLGTLNPRVANVLRWRFGLDCEEETLKQVSERLQITRARVRQLEVVGLKKMRSWLERQHPDWAEDESKAPESDEDEAEPTHSLEA